MDEHQLEYPPFRDRSLNAPLKSCDELSSIVRDCGMMGIASRSPEGEWAMSGRSLWSRIKQFFRPQVETYDTRKVRPGDPGASGPGSAGVTDQRRDGGSMTIGS
jgi:hypothetical protein